jgi:ADP-ribose pyrophosphatase YjhB (NUDIX family)
MPNQQPVITDASGRRQFACSAVIIQSIIVNQDQKFLLLSSPTRNHDGAWQVITGALEAEETILAGVLRETREEVGANLRVRPLGTVHTGTYKYDDNLRYTIVIYYLLAYEGGEVFPGDDMQGSQFGWWSMEEVENEAIKLHNPSPKQKWILRRAVELYFLWKDQNVTLQHILGDITE